MRIEQSGQGPAFKAAYMPSQILVLMPLGFGPFSFLDPLILLCPACTLLLQSSRLSRHAACLAPPWAADAPKSLLPRSRLGFARTPISKTPTTSQPAQMLQPPACLPLDAGSSASGEMPRLSKDAQTSPLPQMLHPGRREGGDATTSQAEARCQWLLPWMLLAWMPKWGVGSYSPATAGAAGAWAAISGLHHPDLPSTSQQNLICGFRWWTMKNISKAEQLSRSLAT